MKIRIQSELFERLAFDLANSLSGQVKFRADLLECVADTVSETKAELEDALFSVREVLKQAFHLVSTRNGDCRLLY